jgi:hypothetical protein
VSERLRDGPKALRGVRHQLRLRPQAVEEQAEHPVEAGADVDLGLAPPGRPVAHDGPAGEDGDQEVPVDPVVPAQPGVRHRQEAALPRGASREAPLERLRGQVVQAAVELGQTQAAGHDRRRLVFLREKLADERAELPGLGTPPVVAQGRSCARHARRSSDRGLIRLGPTPRQRRLC